MPIRKSGSEAGAALHRHRELFLSHLLRAGRRGFLASQLHELRPVSSDASFQFVLQGFGQDNVPEVRPEAGIIPYRGFQLGAFDTIVGLNPWKYDTGMFTLPPRVRRHRQPWPLQVQAEKLVVQHIYKGTCLTA